MDKIATLKKWIAESNRIVAFTGAGVSTESGIKDFRSKDGLYNEKGWTNSHSSTESGIPDFRSVDGLYSQKFDYPPETIISHSFYERDPAYFFRFYREKMLPLGFAPNITHRVLARWEQEGKLSAVVTQNIDGLHQKAGSKAVYELHGSVLRNYCTRCGKFHSAEFIKESTDVPRCACGGIVKPDVVLYEESLDGETMEKSVAAIADADLLIVAGTSLTVYPAAGLIRYYGGNRLVLINRDETPYDAYADLVFHNSLGDIFSQL
ncbi:MAG: NAD-dependent protein deacylase [Oscillospiraceae bacterium]|nr:NAD-dependent protein deacylase [Oscillospiraceae bacterium]